MEICPLMQAIHRIRCQVNCGARDVVHVSCRRQVGDEHLSFLDAPCRCMVLDHKFALFPQRPHGQAKPSLNRGNRIGLKMHIRPGWEKGCFCWCQLEIVRSLSETLQRCQVVGPTIVENKPGQETLGATLLEVVQILDRLDRMPAVPETLETVRELAREARSRLHKLREQRVLRLLELSLLG